ncbi:AAA family ATPase [Stenotrophomonas sp. 364]|uniref:AAA family ATPase n=1 Tax=Stenotrophomonas sp. 364 TaxID=2691571 RepID=UPI0013189DE1|nr:AAA family ATPase [Stenotrophomonas sp. 364]QHB73503.1 AAA family ATPase [Stenotrophomonas sp. 364]
MPSSQVLLHPKFQSTERDLAATLTLAQPGSLVFLIGISGVGKSELRYRSMRSVAGAPSGWDKGILPAIAVRATLTDRGFFNPKDLAMRLAHALRVPDLTWLSDRDQIDDPEVVHAKLEIAEKAQPWLDARRSTTEHALRFEFERHARARRLRWIFIEECASIGTLSRGRSVHNYVLGLMQLAEECGLTIILFGTPRAAALWDCHPDIRRRSLFVWAQRYREDRSEDHRPFASLVSSLGKHLPLERPDLLVQNLELALANSAGSYGEVKQFLLRADQARVRRDSHTIDLCDLHQASYSREHLLGMWEQAKAFDGLCEINTDAADLGYLNLKWGAAEGRVGQ